MSWGLRSQFFPIKQTRVLGVIDIAAVFDHLFCGVSQGSLPTPHCLHNRPCLVAIERRLGDNLMMPLAHRHNWPFGFSPLDLMPAPDHRPPPAATLSRVLPISHSVSAM